MKTVAVKFSLLITALLVSDTAHAQSNFSSNVIGVGVVVADLQRSLDFYVKGIGMVKTGSFTIIPYFMGYRFSLFNYATRETGGFADFDYFRITDTISQSVSN